MVIRRHRPQLEAQRLRHTPLEKHQTQPAGSLTLLRAQRDRTSERLLPGQRDQGRLTTRRRLTRRRTAAKATLPIRVERASLRHRDEAAKQRREARAIRYEREVPAPRRSLVGSLQQRSDPRVARNRFWGACAPTGLPLQPRQASLRLRPRQPHPKQLALPWGLQEQQEQVSAHATGCHRRRCRRVARVALPPFAVGPGVPAPQRPSCASPPHLAASFPIAPGHWQQLQEHHLHLPPAATEIRRRAAGRPRGHALQERLRLQNLLTARQRSALQRQRGRQQRQGRLRQPGQPRLRGQGLVLCPVLRGDIGTRDRPLNHPRRLNTRVEEGRGGAGALERWSCR